MHTRLASYLLDNRDQIIENWLTEVDVPPPEDFLGADGGVVPYAFFAEAFDAVLKIIQVGPQGLHFTANSSPMGQFIGTTCACRARCAGGRICMELHDGGLEAFMSVFEEAWDTEHEFSELDRECSKDLINHALSGFLGREIDACPQKNLRTDCPFVTR